MVDLPGLRKSCADKFGQVLHGYRTVVEHRFVKPSQLKLVILFALNLLSQPIH